MSGQQETRILTVGEESGGVAFERALRHADGGQFQVGSASSADDALAELAAAEFDCVVSAYNLPGRDGIELLRRVRERQGSLPFVLVTAEDDERVASRAVSAGVTEYVPTGACVDHPEFLVERCRAGVETADATLEVEDEVTVQGDHHRLRHVFENPLSNAVTHGGDGVTVRVGRTNDGRLYLNDDGPGIPAGKREEVVQPGQTSVAEGTGFGLSIVKRIVDAHGWEVTVTGGREGGARFEFDTVGLSS